MSTTFESNILGTLNFQRLESGTHSTHLTQMSRGGPRHVAPEPPVGFRRFLLETATEEDIVNLTVAIERDRIVSYVTRSREAAAANVRTALGGVRIRAPEPVYEVERIADFYMSPVGQVFAHVEWHGYPMSESTYEPMQSFNDEELEELLFLYLDRELQRRALVLVSDLFDDSATESAMSELDESNVQPFTVAGEHTGKCFGRFDSFIMMTVSQ